MFLEILRTQPVSFQLCQGIIRLKGPDALAYLNSQTTNNLEKLKDNTFQFNSVLDLAGKIISSFIVIRMSSSELLVIVDDAQIDATTERIEKFHISEDFDLSVETCSAFLNLNSDSNNAKGLYFFEGDQVSIGQPEFSLGDEKDFRILSIVTGVPRLSVHAKPGELINNTYFDELSVDYSKGCFPGQETVAKINTRRGAACKPVLIISDNRMTELKVEEKKAGNIIDCVELAGKWYHYASVLRNYRINQAQIGSGKIHYYPYIAISKKELAQDYYDHAVELFQRGEDLEAKKYFEKAVSTDPTFEDAFESLGVLYGRMEEYEKAIELMEKLKDINPKSMMAYTNLSLYHMKLGHIETAEDFKSQATLLNFELLGDEAERKRQKEEVEQRRLAERDRREGMFKQVLEMDSEDAMANNGMGEILLEKESYKEALAHFKKAIEADKKYSVAYLGVAKCYVQLNKIDELKSILSVGIEVASKNGDLMPANEMQSIYSQYISS